MIVDPKTLIAGLSAVVAIISACVSVYANWRSRKLSEVSLKIAEFSAAQSHRKALFDWSSSCQDVLSEAYCLFALEGASSEQRRTSFHQLMTKLTSLIDKGRWLLPNDDHERYGTNKEAAYTGIRQLPLDCLVEAYNSLNRDFQQEQRALNQLDAKLLKLKREFTSSIQEKLEPRVVESEIARIKGGLLK